MSQPLQQTGITVPEVNEDSIREVKSRLHRQFPGLGRIVQLIINRFPQQIHDELWRIAIYVMRPNLLLGGDQSPIHALMSGRIHDFHRAMAAYFNSHR
ncbi:hypothetical protein H6758_05090 [Candidatus Nomurabacteria bacterium]|nr:hypothetical protein [Candidatus Nomurabacteria bacterium]